MAAVCQASLPDKDPRKSVAAATATTSWGNDRACSCAASDRQGDTRIAGAIIAERLESKFPADAVARLGSSGVRGQLGIDFRLGRVHTFWREFGSRPWSNRAAPVRVCVKTPFGSPVRGGATNSPGWSEVEPGVCANEQDISYQCLASSSAPRVPPGAVVCPAPWALWMNILGRFSHAP